MLMWTSVEKHSHLHRDYKFIAEGIYFQEKTSGDWDGHEKNGGLRPSVLARSATKPSGGLGYSARWNMAGGTRCHMAPGCECPAAALPDRALRLPNCSRLFIVNKPPFHSLVTSPGTNPRRCRNFHRKCGWACHRLRILPHATRRVRPRRGRNRHLPLRGSGRGSGRREGGEKRSTRQKH